MSNRNQYKQNMDVKYDNLGLIDVPAIIAENKERWFGNQQHRSNGKLIFLISVPVRQ